MSANPPLRVEMVLPTLAVGGMEVMASHLTRALANRGHDVGITCLESGGELADELRADGYRVSLVPTPGLRTNLRAPALEAWLRKRQPTVVHVHSGAWMKGAHAATRAKVSRIVHTEHGLLDHEPWYSGFQKRLAARHTHRIAAVSEPLRDYLVATAKLDPRKVLVIPNGIDTSRFTPGPRTGALRRTLQLPDECPVIGTVAGLKPVKDHFLLLDAFTIVRGEMPQVRLVIVGEGPLRAALEERARALAIADAVWFAGGVTDPAPVYRDLDLFVSSSKAEGTSISILEAMASGVAVVATSVGGSPDALAHGACGRLVPPADSARLASAIVSLLRERAERERLAVAARSRTVERYSEDAMVEMYETVYRGTVGTFSCSTTSRVLQCAE